MRLPHGAVILFGLHLLIISKRLCPLSFQVLWKSYIDFEIEQEEFGNTRNLYKRLLQRTQHVKVRTASQLSVLIEYLEKMLSKTSD